MGKEFLLIFSVNLMINEFAHKFLIAFVIHNRP
jgi:hypothetical protein